jgi:hypothetical protein
MNLYGTVLLHIIMKQLGNIISDREGKRDKEREIFDIDIETQRKRQRQRWNDANDVVMMPKKNLLCLRCCYGCGSSCC